MLKLTAVLALSLAGSACVFVQRDKKNDDLHTFLLLFLLVENAKEETSTAQPTVTMTNNGSGPEQYGIYTDSGCSGTATHDYGVVSTGSTTSAATVNAGDYYFSIFGVSCTSSAITLSNGFTYNCSSASSTITCSGTPL